MLSLRILGVLFLLAVLLAVSRLTAFPDEPADEAHVIIISIDGFPAWALWDEAIPLPTLRKLATEGAYARAMIPSTPSVTWPNHTTLVTGVHPEKHGLFFNGKIVRAGVGEPVTLDMDRDREDLVHHPTLYDVAHAAGLRTAEVNWPGTRNAETLDDSFPDAIDNLRHTTPRLRSELIDLELIDEDADAIWEYAQVQRDRIWLEAARHLLRERAPNLLLFHLLNVDSIHHGYGEGTAPGHTALALADAYVGALLETLDEAGIREQTTLFVVSDHGFMNVTHRLHPNVLLREQGFLDIHDDGRVDGARVQVVSAGGTAMVYFTDPARGSALIDTVHALFEEAEGIARVLTPEDYGRYGLPDPSQSEQVGDLLLAADTSYAFDNAADEADYVVELDRAVGYHGYLADLPEMEALFIASGRGIEGGVELGTVDNRSVAPTAATLLGIALDEADGEVLEAMLK